MLPFVTADGRVAESLAQLNRRLADELGSGEFVALTMARYHPRDRLVELSNAGAPDPYLVRPGHPPQPMSVPGPRLPLGVRREVAYASRTVEMHDGEGLLLLTDGLPEARDASGEPIGYEAFESMLGREPSTGSPASRLSWLFDTVQRTTGRVPEDDWTAAMLMPREVERTP